jgi:YidC/Oxa1 family membrane protein insertase
MILGVVVLQQIETVLEDILRFYHDGGISWGWSIVLLTVSVRLVILPLTIKQFRSMIAMQEVQPKIKALQAKYKGKSAQDKQEMQREIMAIYKEHNVNPFASCLPLVFQLPVFFGLFRVLRNFANSNPGGDPSFLGIHNIFLKLSDIGGATEWIVAILYLASMLGSTLLFSFITDKQQRYMFAAMSIAFVFFVLSVPAGVGIYWITTNLWTIAQQGLIKRTMGHRLAAARAAAAASGKGSKGGSGGSSAQPASPKAPKPPQPRGSSPRRSSGGSRSRKAKRKP